MFHAKSKQFAEGVYKAMKLLNCRADDIIIHQRNPD